MLYKYTFVSIIFQKINYENDWLGTLVKRGARNDIRR